MWAAFPFIFILLSVTTLFLYKINILWSDASCKALFCCASGPSESQLQTMWWKAEFLSVNWVVCLSHWIHLPGKHSRCCTKTGKRRSVFTLNSWLFFYSSLFPHHLRLPQSGSTWSGSSAGQNDWQVSVRSSGVSPGQCWGSCLCSGADGQTGSRHYLWPLLQGRGSSLFLCL